MSRYSAVVAKALTWAVVTAVPVVAVAGPLAGTAAAAPKPHASPPAYTTKPANPTNTSTATFNWTPPAGYTYLCSHDGSRTSSCTPPVTMPSLADGLHTFTVKSQLTGARSSSSSYSWRIDTVAPAAPSVVAPPSPTRATSVAVQFSDSDTSAVAFTCTVDAGTAAQRTVTGCTSPFTASGLAEGNHTLSVAASDAAGNAAAAATSWVVDTTAPDVPVILGPASPTRATDASIGFSTVDAATFTCALDGNALGACTSPQSVTALADGTHHLAVTATDAAGNASSSAVDWVVDTTAPPVPSLVTGPADPTDDTAPAVSFTDFDPSGVAFSCTVTDTTTNAIVQGPQPCSSPFAVAGATTDGDRYQLAVAATDGAGNAGAPLDVAWTVNLGLTPAPAAFTAAPASPSNVTTPSFTYIATDLGQTGGTTGFACSLDGAAFTACGTPDATAATIYTVASPLGDGAHTFAVETTNGSAVSNPVTWQWTVDTTPPPAPAVTAPDASTLNPTIRFTDADPTVTFACAVDGGAFVACSSPWPTPSGLSNGSHTLTVAATDLAGNTTAAAPVTFTVRNAPVTSPGGGSLDTTAPSVTAVSVPAALTAAAAVHFGETVTGLASGGVKLVLTGTTTAVGTRVACLSGSTAVACSGSYDVVRLTPSAPLVAGQHYTVVATAGATHDLAGNPSTSSSTAFRALRTVQESNVAVRATWASVRTTTAYGGSYVREHLAGATASWVFNGTGVTWWTYTGPDQGKAAVYVDGVRKAIVDNYATAVHARVARIVKGLVNQRHTLRIVVLGVKGATAGKGTFVVIDGFTVGRTLTASPVLATTWRSVASSHLSAGRAYVADVAGAAVTFTFRGTSVSWLTMRAADQGIARVYLDGVLKATIDNYGATAYAVSRTLSRLTDKVHTLKIVVTGTHRRGATGSVVTVDRFAVG